MIDRTIAGRYHIVQALGAGGLAEVFAAFDSQLNRQVAIKMLREPLATDPAIVERFLREARVAAGLSHPSIVQIFDVGLDGQQPYVVMELIEGQPLRQYVTDQAPFTLADTLT